MLRHTAIAPVLFAMFASLVTVRAQDCPRGDLDRMYCDRDGDLVADAPTDPKQLVNPSVLVFAYTPVEDPAVYGKVWDGFIKHMEKTTGKKVVFFPVQSNAAEIEAMRSGRLHVAGFNTGSNPIAVNCAGFVPFAIMGGKDGQFGYEMEIIVPADSPIKTPADLKNKKVAFTEPTSNSGFKAPSAILKADFNLEKDRDFSAVFSGKHDNSTRSINSLIWALMLVTIVGPGVLAGILAIGLRSIGFCAKLLYEAIEEIDEHQVEAVRAMGASAPQVAAYGIVPQVMPAFAGISVFRWDINIRESTVLGLVGAGGIGLPLNAAITTLAWTKVSLILLVILASVVVSEWISAKVRRSII